MREQQPTRIVPEKNERTSANNANGLTVPAWLKNKFKEIKEKKKKKN